MLNPVSWLHSNRLSRIIFSFFLVIFFPSSTTALIPASLKEDDNPIEINSDHANFDEKTGNTTYQDNVHAAQGARHLWSDSLIIHRTREGKIDHILAQGKPAYFISSTPPKANSRNTAIATPQLNVNSPNNTEIRGKANFIHYYPDDHKIIFLQNAELVQNDRLIRGDHLIYFINHRTLISESSVNAKTVVIINSKGNKAGAENHGQPESFSDFKIFTHQSTDPSNNHGNKNDMNSFEGPRNNTHRDNIFNSKKGTP